MFDGMLLNTHTGFFPRKESKGGKTRENKEEEMNTSNNNIVPDGGVVPNFNMSSEGTRGRGPGVSGNNRLCFSTLEGDHLSVLGI